MSHLALPVCPVPRRGGSHSLRHCSQAVPCPGMQLREHQPSQPRHLKQQTDDIYDFEGGRSSLRLAQVGLGLTAVGMERGNCYCKVIRDQISPEETHPFPRTEISQKTSLTGWVNKVTRVSLQLR